MTWIELVRAMAILHGFEIGDVDAEWVLIEHTHWPLADATFVLGQLDRYFDDLAWKANR